MMHRLWNAGPDVTVSLPSTVATLSGTATDDGKPNPPAHLTITWTQQSGPGTVTFANNHLASTTATASAYGTYVLRLTASDGALQTYDEVTVTWQGYTYEGYDPVPTGGEGGTVVHVTNLECVGRRKLCRGGQRQQPHCCIRCQRLYLRPPLKSG